ncbi:MAG: FtsH protease activity modulator HflK [Gammaproteobacteria bacterium]|nr:FtsH protease activity modulator HflK [Gammaproteobacteria bacterium]
MAWNEPGNSGDKDKDPWGKQRGEQGPPDLDEIVKNLQRKFRGLFGGRGGGGGSGRGGAGGFGGVIGVLVALLVIWAVYSSVYILNERQNGVVLRFGKYVTTIQPGFNLRLPYPIETVNIVDVQTIQSFTVGQGTNEALMLTKDKNIVDIEYVVQFQVSDAKKFVLNTKDPVVSLEQATQTAVREMVGQNDMDYVQTQGRSEFAIKSKERIQQILERYNTGLTVTNFNMQKAQPPRQVIPAYEEVNAAQQDKEAEINKAEAFANTIIPKAEGQADQIRVQAEQYKQTLIARATGDADRFKQLLAQYEKAPAVTRERLYLETMQEVISRSKKVLVDIKKGNNLLYLPLDKIASNPTRDNETNSSTSGKQADGTTSHQTPDMTSDTLRSRGRGGN